MPIRHTALPDVDAVHVDTALGRFQQAEDDVDERRLARPRTADETDRAARGDGDVDIPQGGGFGVLIAILDVAKRDLVVQRHRFRRAPGIRTAVDLRFEMHQIGVDRLQRNHVVAQVREMRDHRADHLLQPHQADDEQGQGHQDRLRRPSHQDQSHRQREQAGNRHEFDRWRDGLADKQLEPENVGHFSDAVADLVGEELFLVQDSGLLDGAEPLVQRLYEVTTLRLLDPAAVLQLGADRLHAQKPDGAEERHPGEGDPGLHHEQKKQHAQQDDPARADLQNRRDDLVGDDVDLAVDIAQQFRRIAGHVKRVGRAHIGVDQAPTEIDPPIGDVARLAVGIEHEKSALDSENGNQHGRRPDDQILLGHGREPREPIADDGDSGQLGRIDDCTHETGNDGDADGLEQCADEHQKDQKQARPLGALRQDRHQLFQRGGHGVRILAPRGCGGRTSIAGLSLFALQSQN